MNWTVIQGVIKIKTIYEENDSTHSNVGVRLEYFIAK